MMDLHPGLMIWTIITFVILLIILKRVAWNPILKALEAREKGIKDNIEAADAARLEAEKALAEYKRQLSESQAEAQKIVAQARQDAERVREDLIEKSKKEAETQIERARKQIELESQEAISSIRGTIADLVSQAAEKVIGKSLDSDDQKRLILESIEENPN